MMSLKIIFVIKLDVNNFVRNVLELALLDIEMLNYPLMMMQTGKQS